MVDVLLALEAIGVLVGIIEIPGVFDGNVIPRLCKILAVSSLKDTLVYTHGMYPVVEKK